MADRRGKVSSRNQPSKGTPERPERRHRRVSAGGDRATAPRGGRLAVARSPCATRDASRVTLDPLRRESPVWTRSFALGALDRAVKSFAQSLIVLWSADEGFNVLEITAGPTFGVAVGAAALSLLTSIASSPVGDPGSTSLIPGAD